MDTNTQVLENDQACQGVHVYAAEMRERLREALKNISPVPDVLDFGVNGATILRSHCDPENTLVIRVYCEVDNGPRYIETMTGVESADKTPPLTFSDLQELTDTICRHVLWC